MPKNVIFKEAAVEQPSLMNYFGFQDKKIVRTEIHKDKQTIAYLLCYRILLKNDLFQYTQYLVKTYKKKKQDNDGK